MFAWFNRKKRTNGTGLASKRTLYLPESLYKRMIQHCEEERPLEACGLLVGVGGHVESAYATDNVHRSPVVYKVDDRQLLQVFGALRSDRQEIIGIYHSHVRSAPEPSRTDIAQATWPESFYVIVSLVGRRPAVKAWRIVDKAVTEHQIVVQRKMGGLWHDLRQAARQAVESEGRTDIP